MEKIGDTSSAVDPLANLLKKDAEAFGSPDKVAIALEATQAPANLDILDLRDRITELAEFIRTNSRETVIPAAPELSGP